jgi:arabinan endo-1,5-alpha-L-arabinosidase
MQRRASWWLVSMVVPIALALAMVLAFGSSAARATSEPLTQTSSALASVEGGETYTNPLPITIPDTFTNTTGMVETCADPSIIRSQTKGDSNWYVYCTSDPLNSGDRNEAGDDFNFPLIPTLRSVDLVNWTYVGPAFDTRPSYATSNGLFAPEIVYFDGTYYLYYGVVDTNLGGSAMGVSTAPTPMGPWTHEDVPAIEPHPANCCPGSRRLLIDAEVNEVNGQKYIMYGTYFGGISARELSDDGLISDPATQVQITIDNRYEAPEILFHDGFYYLFVSATDCCRGPLTGYSVFVGRSANLLGPYVDRDGVSLLAPRVGGTTALSMNGNGFVGPGHNSVFTDFDGQVWTVYHAIDQEDPYLLGSRPGCPAACINKRPLMMDPVDFGPDGWPTVRGDFWISDTPQPGPAAQPGESTAHVPTFNPPDEPGELIPELSDEFTGSLGSQWSWIRMPTDTTTYEVTSDTFRFDAQAAELYEDNNTASILVMDAPAEESYIVETRLNLNLPNDESCCYNFVQAGMVIYKNDDAYVKANLASIFNTRQVEFGKEWPAEGLPQRWPRYGNTVAGPMSDWTYLRIVKKTFGEEEHYTIYSKADIPGATWVRGGTWTHDLEQNVAPMNTQGAETAQIGLISMNDYERPDLGFTANFDYVRVYRPTVPTSVTVNEVAAQPGGLPVWPLVAGSVALLGAAALRRRQSVR